MTNDERTEEIFNAVTHGAGAVAAAAATAVLVTLAASRGDAWQIVGVSVFCATLILLYLASALYHAARDPVLRARLQALDHSAIYLLIAGTYTPFMIGALRGPWGWSMLGVVWTLALTGVLFKLRFAGRFRLASTLMYLGMGWLSLVAIVPMVRALGTPTLLWLAAGGLLYTAGTPFYQLRRIPHSHAVWHLFVLGGSVCHTIAVAIHL
ncbi:hemolysin III family protein [soil metagenome]